jgi:hypothetical protein
MDKNTIEVTCVKENEDGSADIEFEVGSEMKEKIVGEGINFLLIKGILGGTTEDILRWADRGKEEEQIDKNVADFNEAMLDANDL